MDELISRAAVFAESLDTRSLGAKPEHWCSITSATHPLLFEAMDTITHDGGGGCHKHYNLPPDWVGALDRMEKLLGRLSQEQREVIAIGECSEQEQLVHEFEGLEVTHLFLNAFFEDFIESEGIDAARIATRSRSRS